ncbi:hypothetical protein ABPG77_009679 [Micractinium sp. CCAP 211/92]
MGRILLAAVDESPISQRAALWLLNSVARPGDDVHLLAIAPPPGFAMQPAPIASAGAVAAISLNWEQQRKAEEERCRATLLKVVHQLPEGRLEELSIHRHVLPAAGGASGVAESVVAFAKEHGADLVAVGSRGMGAVKSTLMSLVGLGSVSAYLVHHMQCPVAICRGREVDAAAQESKKVLVALDDSAASRQALEWVVDNALGPKDELHLVCVALPIPYPVSAVVDDHLPQPDVPAWRRRCHEAQLQAEAVTKRALRDALAARDQAPPAAGSARRVAAAAAAPAAQARPQQIVTEDASASAVLEADEFDAATQDSLHYAREIVTRAVDSAAARVDKSRVFFKALAPEGGASDVGESIVHYAKENAVSMAVLGARGLGSWQRAIMSFVGLGSVSDYVVHHCDIPVVIVKH